MSISNVIKDMATGPDGETVDPARLIGYGIVVLGALVWMTLTDKLEKLLCSILGEYYVGGKAEEALAEEIRAILRKAQEK